MTRPAGTAAADLPPAPAGVAATRSLPFVKMQGLGNDFLVLDARAAGFPSCDWPTLARRWCSRHFGVGADGLLLILPSASADARMRTINADGSEAQMCGNGIRCVARYLYELASPPRCDWTIETLAGIIRPQVLLQAGEVAGIRVNMGAPRFGRADIPVAGDPQRLPQREQLQVAGDTFEFSAVSMGNPHCVIVVEDLAQLDFPRLGPAIESHPRFPARINVEFVQILSPQRVRVKVWERGAGPTLACGTGACGVLAVTATLGLTERQATVELPGGDLAIEWAADGQVYMTGPAETVFRGAILP